MHPKSQTLLEVHIRSVLSFYIGKAKSVLINYRGKFNVPVSANLKAHFIFLGQRKSFFKFKIKARAFLNSKSRQEHFANSRGKAQGIYDRMTTPQILLEKPHFFNI